MDTYMDISLIREKYCNRDYKCDMEIPMYVTEDFVFDENLSVKRNREMVKEHNASIIEMQKLRNAKNEELTRNLHNDVIAYIENTYNMSRDQASIVEAYVYREYHSFMGDYFGNIDSVAEMVENVLNKERE